jgi:hypothetical protein
MHAWEHLRGDRWAALLADLAALRGCEVSALLAMVRPLDSRPLADLERDPFDSSELANLADAMGIQALALVWIVWALELAREVGAMAGDEQTGALAAIAAARGWFGTSPMHEIHCTGLRAALEAGDRHEHEGPERGGAIEVVFASASDCAAVPRGTN